ncbi:MAG: PH domain-containing protein [Actinobacteria bacterium]|nr:PH domain-containing protein [Actinomycetota bacterium]
MPASVRIRQPIALRVYIGVFGIGWCGFVAAGFVDLVPRPESLLLLGMFVFGASLTYRMIRLEVVADSSGLLIRNYYRTRRYDWSDVEDFRVGGPTLGMPFGKVIHALLADGEIVTLDVTMRPWAFGRGTRERERYLQQLREWAPRR